MQNGVLALQAGLDPLRYLSLTGTELLVAQEIIKRAGEQKIESDKAHWKHMAASVASGIVMAFRKS